MEMNLNANFSAIEKEDLELINAGSDGFFGFIGDMYDSWNNMWHKVGENIHSWFCPSC
ncbi:hypothetical protein SAMN02745196_02020 [Clostridium collagenovorans DSM 3089]|uniref:Uncharacterized protein n=1 Tax=Clostridium collagenovorans DSM 3089 TaxID=1121306 RepID=A0A1M5X5A1_9CLOT|nr:hypothetical protein [Clostridium collagenovorans]SHH95050.1 hypothetical protein SAMN02745196_02020 [Clostridium collagenovorans DSM 3089]